MSTWDKRPKDLNPDELLAWALCQHADAVDMQDSGGMDIAAALDRLTAVLHDIGMVQGGIVTIGGLQYIADRVGGNLERIADQIEKGTTHDD